MGLLDTVFKSLDATLKAVEEGALEQKIVQAVDTLEAAAQKAPDVLEKAAALPQQALHGAEQKAVHAEHLADIAQTGVARTGAIIRDVQQP